MAKKPTNTAVESSIEGVALGRGATVFSARNTGTALPEASRRTRLHITSDIRDLREGRSETVSIWSDAPDMDFVSHMLADVAVRNRVADFFLRREIAQVVVGLIPTSYFKPEETSFGKSEFYDAILAHVQDRNASLVIMELLCGPMTRLGTLSNNGSRAHQIRYPFARVTTRNLAHEVNVQQVETTLGQVNLDAINRSARQTRNAFADRLADLLRPIGVRLLDAAELSSVMDDLILCVRAHIAPYGLNDGDIEAIPSEWREHASVAELATCLPFVRAALQLPSRSRFKLANEGRVLEQWIRIIMNYLRDSRRYKWLGREAMLRHHTTRHVRDSRGEIKSVVAYRSVRAQPVAQAVIAIADVGAVDIGARFISATKDMLADSIQAAYARADFSTDHGAQVYLDMARDLVGIGYAEAPDAILVDAVLAGGSLSDLAALVAKTVEVETDENGIVIVADDAIAEARARDTELDESTWDPKWWFTVPTTELNLTIRSGRHYGDHVVTCDAVEALKAHAELTAIEAYPAQPQQLGPKAFLSTLIGFEDSDLLSLDRKFKFDVPFAGRQVSGAFQVRDFANLRSARLATVVKPHFNAAVIAAESAAFGAASNLLIEVRGSDRTSWDSGLVPADSVFNSLQRRLCIKLLQLAQGLSPAFREDVQTAIVSRALAMDEVTTEDLVVQRAQMMQQSFTAQCDVIALMFFLYLQGIETPEWVELASSDIMAQVCMDIGSDRKPRA